MALEINEVKILIGDLMIVNRELEKKVQELSIRIAELEADKAKSAKGELA
jgi:hypothetical protein